MSIWINIYEPNLSLLNLIDFINDKYGAVDEYLNRGLTSLWREAMINGGIDGTIASLELYDDEELIPLLWDVYMYFEQIIERDELSVYHGYDVEWQFNKVYVYIDVSTP